MTSSCKIIFSVLLLAFSMVSQADEVDILKVVAHQSGDKSWTFAVTVKHADTGWDHYANEWQVIGADNNILATRTLYHPHVDEQPFTRNTSGVKIPAGIETVTIIAKDSVHGVSKTAMQINLKTKETKKVPWALQKK